MSLNKIIVVGVLTIVIVGLASFGMDLLPPSAPQINSIYDLRVKSLDGREIDFSQYKGQKLLIVNTASKCGKTPQYADLEKLHELYGDKIKILGFPSNNFLWQEPGSNSEIAEFCQKNYGLEFCEVRDQCRW